jgi:(R,R)-butanediol dehydrogenase/meso-butanediol dehydrogenase/diacetyl reductase
VKALTYYGSNGHGRGDFRVEDVPEPKVTPGTVLLDVDWCGICGSDLHEYETDTASGYTTPVILGHEFAGTVSEIGAGVENVKVGQRVTVEPFMYCMECEDCRKNEYHLCQKLGVVGVHSIGGGFAEKSVVPAYTVHALPDSVSTETAALTEPMAVGWHAMRKANFQAGQTALVLGAGPIGLTTLLCARAFGAGLTVVSVRRPGARHDAAKRLHADVVLDSSVTDVVAEVMELTNGRGVDAVFETTGSQEALDTAMAAVRNGGVIASLAVWVKPPTFDFMQVLLKEPTIVGSKGYNDRDFPEVIAAMGDGRITDSDLIVSTKIDLDDVITGGFDMLEKERSAHVKVLVTPGT